MSITRVDNEQKARDAWQALFKDNNQWAVRAQEVVQRQLVESIAAVTPRRVIRVERRTK